MKAKELMIGDWVHYRGTNIQVTSLYDKGNSNEIGWSDKESVWVNGRTIEPIPLTGEILVNNGFRETDYNGYISYVCEVPYGTGDDDDYAYLCMTDFGKYWQMDVSLVVGGTQTNIPNCGVHHLQHMLTLLGIEIEIKL